MSLVVESHPKREGRVTASRGPQKLSIANHHFITIIKLVIAYPRKACKPKKYFDVPIRFRRLHITALRSILEKMVG